MAFIGQLTGKQYESFEAMVYEERREAMRRSNNSEVGKEYANITLDQLKAICIDAQIIQEGRSGPEAERAKHDATVWLSLHPEYINNDYNKKLMEHEMGVINPTIQDLENAYQALRASDLLQLDQAEIVKQEQQAANQRAKGIKKAGGPLAPMHTEDEMYSMSLEDLRKYDQIENQNRMQRQGEEGGGY